MAPAPSGGLLHSLNLLWKKSQQYAHRCVFYMILHSLKKTMNVTLLMDEFLPLKDEKTACYFRKGLSSAFHFRNLPSANILPWIQLNWYLCNNFPLIHNVTNSINFCIKDISKSSTQELFVRLSFPFKETDSFILAISPVLYFADLYYHSFLKLYQSENVQVKMESGE